MQPLKAIDFSPSTVVEAYERLQTDGIIYSRPSTGFSVSDITVLLSLAAMGSNLNRAVDPLWVSRQFLETSDSALKPGCGWLPPDWLYEAGRRRVARAIHPINLTHYESALIVAIKSVNFSP